MHILICFFFFLPQGEFLTQKEAAWAISNFTVSGSPQQVRVFSVLSSKGKKRASESSLIVYL